MRAVFAGFATAVWSSLSMSFQAMWPGVSIKDAAAQMYDRGDTAETGGDDR